MKNRIKEIREAKGWSQRKLQEKSGLYQQEISRMEQQKTEISVSDALLLARTFDCSLADLFVGNDARLLSSLDSQKSLPSPEYLLECMRTIAAVDIENIANSLGIEPKEYRRFEQAGEDIITYDQALKLIGAVLNLYNNKKTGQEMQIQPGAKAQDVDEIEMLNRFRKLPKFDKAKVPGLLDALFSSNK